MKLITKLAVVCILCSLFVCGGVSADITKVTGAAETTAYDSNSHEQDHNLTIYVESDFVHANYYGVGFTVKDSDGHNTLKVTKSDSDEIIRLICTPEIKAVIPGSYFTIPDNENPQARFYILTCREYRYSDIYKRKIDYIGVDLTSLIKNRVGHIPKSITIKLSHKPYDGKFGKIKISGINDLIGGKEKTLFELPATISRETEYHDWFE